MPHYPDEIEYSDKYMDDFYEYRHVILPKDVYKRIPRGRLLTEQVLISPCRSGVPLACNSPEGGSTMRSINQNLIFCFSEGPRIAIPRLDFLPQGSSLPPIPSSSEFVIIHHFISRINGTF